MHNIGDARIHKSGAQSYGIRSLSHSGDINFPSKVAKTLFQKHFSFSQRKPVEKLMVNVYYLKMAALIVINRLCIFLQSCKLTVGVFGGFGHAVA